MKLIAAKPVDPSLMPGVHVVERDDRLVKVILASVHTHREIQTRLQGNKLEILGR